MMFMATLFFSIKYWNTITVLNYKKQLHLKILNFKDNSSPHFVDFVLPILNYLRMFIFVYNCVRALGTLGSVKDLF